MGYARVADMIALAGEDAALADHVRHNLYPPPGEGAVDFARAALEAVREGRGDEPLRLGHRLAPSSNEVVEVWHLEAFLETDE